MILSEKLKIILENSTNPIAKQLLKDQTTEAFIKNIDYLDIAIDNPNYISYIPKNRKDIFYIENPVIWEDYSAPHYACFDMNLRRKQAMMGKAGKVVRKLYVDKFNVKDYEAFSLEFYKNNDPLILNQYKFEIVTGEDIRKWYHQDMYHELKGTLGNSCMRYTENQEFFDIYVNNDDISMLILLNKDNKLLGRAIIWKNIYTIDSDITIDTFMDRVYVSNSKDEQLFLNYAKEHNFVYKAYQTYNNHREVVVANEEIKLNMKIPMNTKFDKYPYLDTFVFLGKTALYNYDNKKDVYGKMKSTSGGYEKLEESVLCPLDNIWYRKNNTVYSTYHTCHIPYAKAIYISGIYVYKDYINEKDFKTCEVCGNLVFIDKIKETAFGEITCHKCWGYFWNGKEIIIDALKGNCEYTQFYRAHLKVYPKRLWIKNPYYDNTIGCYILNEDKDTIKKSRRYQTILKRKEAYYNNEITKSKIFR